MEILVFVSGFSKALKFLRISWDGSLCYSYGVPMKWLRVGPLGRLRMELVIRKTKFSEGWTFCSIHRPMGRGSCRVSSIKKPLEQDLMNFWVGKPRWHTPVSQGQKLLHSDPSRPCPMYHFIWWFVYTLYNILCNKPVNINSFPEIFGPF